MNNYILTLYLHPATATSLCSLSQQNFPQRVDSTYYIWFLTPIHLKKKKRIPYKVNIK